MAKETAFQQVRENFQRVEEFGWFAPSKTWTKKFKTWPKEKCLEDLSYRQAAVLFLLTYHRGELHVLITKRSYHVSTHKGIKHCLKFCKGSRLFKVWVWAFNCCTNQVKQWCYIIFTHQGISKLFLLCCR